VSNVDPTEVSETGTNREKTYTCGYSSAAMQIMASRTAEIHARFLLPYLRSGMRLLDCGCGPGSITVGLAKAIAPGEAVGIDIESGQLNFAQAHAAQNAVTNVHFEVGNICDLSFPSNAFDAVFGHAILMQFHDPNPALAEVRRVLKPGGLAAFREPMFSCNVAEPPDSAQDQLWKLFARVLAHNGGDIDIGRRLARLFQSTGFERLTVAASFSGAWAPEAKRASCELWAQLCKEADFMKQAIAFGWIESGGQAAMTAALRAEGIDPVGSFATAWREIIGWKLA
jgi:ubiquinone/menaquinone biosynthesis C-methylase UbiE